MEGMSSGDEYYAETMSMDMLEDIHYVSQYHTIIDRREYHYKIRDCFK